MSPQDKCRWITLIVGYIEGIGGRAGLFLIMVHPHLLAPGQSCLVKPILASLPRSASVSAIQRVGHALALSDVVQLS